MQPRGFWSVLRLDEHHERHFMSGVALTDCDQRDIFGVRFIHDDESSVFKFVHFHQTIVNSGHQTLKFLKVSELPKPATKEQIHDFRHREGRRARGYIVGEH